MKTIHLVYPHGLQISTPYAIGRNLGRRLEQHYQVIYYNLESPVTIQPGPDDILVGHAMPSPFTCFRRNLKQPGWQRVILITPYSHGDPRYNAFIDPFLHDCDLYLAITGNYWFRSVQDSIYAHWLPKMVHLDLAIDRQDFPAIKERFNPPGQRSFVYIGVNKPYKNLGYLNQIAMRLPLIRFHWIGAGQAFSNLKPLGVRDFARLEARKQIQGYDFLITVGNSDPNPTTILEAMSWGLIPVCSEQSGYTGYPGIINLPLDNLGEAVKIVRSLQDNPESQLLEKQFANWQALDKHFHWDRFADQVIEAIESDASPKIKPIPVRRKLYLRWLDLISPYATWRRPRHLSRVLLQKLRSTTNHEPV